MKEKKLFIFILSFFICFFSFDIFAVSEIYLNPGETVFVDMEAGKASQLYFIPSVTGEYAFTSLSQCDTLAALYDENNKELLSDDDGGDISNFYISYNFVADKKYSFSVWYYGDKIDYDMQVELKLIKPDESHIHSYTEKVISGSTCETVGTSAFSCICGDVYYVNNEKLEHNYKVTDIIPSDCTNKGLKTEKCVMCGNIRNTETDPLGHDFPSVFTIDIEPTCKSIGYASRHCIRCDKTTDDTVLEKTQHTEGKEYEVLKAATCTSQGEKVKRCTVCNKILESVAIGKTEHRISSEYVTVKEPTCTAKGEKVRKCTACNKILETVDIERKEHISSEYKIIKAATCTAKGEKVKICTVCSKILESVAVEKIAHIPRDKFEVVKEPTCTSAGEKVRRCDLCNKTIETLSLDKVPHTLEENYKIIKKATCTARGEKVKRCKSCDRIIERVNIKKLGHSFSESYTTDKKATFSENGKKSRHCKRCDSKTDVKSISKISYIALSDTEFVYNGKYKTLKLTVKNSKGKKLKNNKSYTLSYKKKKNIGLYKVTVSFKGDYRGKTTLSYKILPKDITALKATQTQSSISLKWNKVSGNVKYRIYKKLKNGKNKLVAETADNSVTIKKLRSGTEYTFSVIAFKKVNGKTYKSRQSSKVTVSTIPKTVTLNAVSDKSRSVRLNWNNTSCDGYEIFKYNEETGDYELFKRVKGENISTYERNNLKRRKTYTFKIKSYKYNGKEVLYSSFSEAVTVKVK